MTKPIPHYISDFLDYCEVVKGLTPITTRNYARFLNKFTRWLTDHHLLDLHPENLTEDHIHKYRMWLSRLPNAVRHANPGLDVSSQTRYLIALRNLLAFFHERNIPCLPTEKIKLPKERRERRVKFLEFQDVEKIIAAPDTKTFPGMRDRAILETLFSTGMRVAELVSLDKKQLMGALNKTDFELAITGKGGVTRVVFFSERALYWLKKYLDVRKDEEESLFIRLKGPASSSLRLTVRGIELVVQKYAKIAGIPILATPHTLRHSFATDLLSQGVDLRSIQEFLGHKNIQATQIYTHVTNKKLREIHRKFHGGNNE